MSASWSLNRFVPPPAGCTLYMICDGETLAQLEALSAGTLAHVAAAGAVLPCGYWRTSIAADVALMTRNPTCCAVFVGVSSITERRILSAPVERPDPHMITV